MQKNEVTIATGFGPGKTLGQARADLKLSQDEVALQLHLAPRQIVALESDDYANLPEPTYVRGYLRNYALLLGLNPDPILEAYARLVPARKAPVAPKASLGVDQELSGKEPHIKIISYVVAALVIGLAVAWWQSYEPAALPTESVAVAPAEEETLLAPPALEETGPTALSEAMPKTEPAPASPITARTPSLPIAPAPALRSAPSAPPVPPVAIAPVAPNPVAPIASAPVSTPPAATRSAAPAATEPTSVASAPAPSPTVATERGAAASDGRAQIVLRTEQESWAEVRDGHDSRLLYESVPAGRTVKIEGEIPLSVFLGNADGVKVEYNGRPYDISRHKRGLVARFTLGASPQAPAAAADAPTP